jgi:hypothetical protein
MYLFASLIATKIGRSLQHLSLSRYFKSHLILTLGDPIFLPTSRLPWSMTEVFASTDSYSSSCISYSSWTGNLDLSCSLLFSWTWTLTFTPELKSRCSSNCGSLELRILSSYGRIAKERLFSLVFFLYPLLYLWHVFQQAGYQRSSIFVVPLTLYQKGRKVAFETCHNTIRCPPKLH